MISLRDVTSVGINQSIRAEKFTANILKVVSPFQAILDYELSLGIPPGWVNYCISKTSPNGYWHRLERGEIPLDETFYNGFSKDLHNQEMWKAFYKQQQVKNPQLPEDIPTLPSVDAEWLFDEMMTAADHPDPWMHPALLNLRASGKYILAALSNTTIFPAGHKLHRENFFDEPIRKLFDIFISSAHVGIRKPDPKMYEFALEQVNEYAKNHAKRPANKELVWEDGITPDDIVFLDDIGQNLKEARRQGFRTIKVDLGKAFEAVDQLEKVTGLKLAGDHPRIPILPKGQEPKAKI